MKPLNPYYSYIFGEYRRLITPTEPLLFPENCYEIFSFAAEAWSKALGAQAGVRNAVIISDVDLEAQFEFKRKRSDHSAEFQSDIIKRWDYWLTLLDKFGL